MVIVYLQNRGVLPKDHQLMDFDDTRINLQKTKFLRRELLWDDIIAIFPDFSHKPMKYWTHFVFELANGENMGFQIQTTYPYIVGEDYTLARKLFSAVKESLTNEKKYSYVENLIGILHDRFLQNLKKRKLNIDELTFSHPTRWIRSKHRSFRVTYITSALGVLAMIYFGRDFEGWGPYLFPLPFIFFSIVIILIRGLVIRQHKGLLSLKISEDHLIWKDEFGKSETRAISDIVHWELGKTKAALAFSDGAKLNDLEKLRYWPLLREHLLSRLEPREEI